MSLVTSRFLKEWKGCWINMFHIISHLNFRKLTIHRVWYHWSFMRDYSHLTHSWPFCVWLFTEQQWRKVWPFELRHPVTLCSGTSLWIRVQMEPLLLLVRGRLPYLEKGKSALLKPVCVSCVIAGNRIYCLNKVQQVQKDFFFHARMAASVSSW